MSKVPMKRIQICGMLSERKFILEKLQYMGVVQVECSQIKDEHFSYQETTSSIQQFKKMVEKLEQTEAVIQEFSPVKTSLLSSLGGKKVLSPEEFQHVVDHKSVIQDDACKVLALKKEYDEANSRIGDLKGQIESLGPWMSLDIPMNYKGTENVRAFVGMLASSMTESQISEQLNSALAGTGDEEELPEVNVQIYVISTEKNLTCMVALCHRNDEARVEKALRGMSFTEPQFLVIKKPADAVSLMQEEVAELEKTAAEKAEQIKCFADVRDKVRILSDYYRMRSQKYETIGEIPQTDNVFFLSGYIPAKKSEKIKSYMEAHYTVSVEYEEIPEEEDVPVLLKNNPVSNSIEGVLGSYGLPTKHDIDPSAIMYWFYVIFFGMMLSDAAYGLIMTIACLIALIAFPRMNAGLKKSVKLFLACGISTAVWGFLFGGFFGDVITVVSTTFFHHPVTLKPLWFAPLDDPMRMLIYSLFFGIIHLYTGLGIKGYMCIRDGKIVDFVSDVLSWFLFVSGLVLVLVSSDFFEGIAGMKIAIPSAGVTVCWGVAIAGALILLFMAGRSSKNPVLRILLGAYEIYGVTSWLSDVLSYSRLLALGLATGVIAQVVNQIGSMFGSGPLGVILFIVVFLFGHTLNFAINVLGAYVHSNRLEYVEFFGKFYESGGTPFKPFVMDTKYVDIESKED